MWVAFILMWVIHTFAMSKTKNKNKNTENYSGYLLRAVERAAEKEAVDASKPIARRGYIFDLTQ